MRKLFLGFGWLLLLSNSMLWGDTLASIRARGEIVIGTDATYPPFEQKVGDHLEGFDIDLGNAIARKLGVKARWVNADFGGIFPALLSGRFDIVMSIVTITPERSRYLAFSHPYYRSGNRLAVRKGDKRRFNGLEKLRGHIVGAQLNTTGQFVVEKFGGIEVRKYNTIDLALLDLKNGRIDAVSADEPALLWQIQRGYPELALTGPFLTKEVYGIALRPSDNRLREAINRALSELEAEGIYARLYRKWFGRNPPSLASLSPSPALQEERRKPLFSLALLKNSLPLLLLGMVWTLQLALFSLAGGLPIGLLLALGCLSRFPVLSTLARVYIEVMRGTPLLVQIFFIYFVLPGTGIRLPEVATALIALSLNSGAYVAEIFRAGIESIDVGQREAGLALGLTSTQVMFHIVLPQAVRRIIPPLTNEGIALLKDSSLVSVMGMTELTRTGQELSSRFASPLTIWPAVGLLYLGLTLPLARLSQWMERRWGMERRWANP